MGKGITLGGLKRVRRTAALEKTQEVEEGEKKGHWHLFKRISSSLLEQGTVRGVRGGETRGERKKLHKRPVDRAGI